MSRANAIRLQIEAALSSRIPSALTPAPKIIRPTSSVGIEALDDLLGGGLPVGAITELTGTEGAGRTSLALSFLRNVTDARKVAAWIDVSDRLRPEDAAAAGVDLSRLLWVRCGVTGAHEAVSSAEDTRRLSQSYRVAPQTRKGLHGGGFGPHPRNEQKGLSEAVSSLFPGDLHTQHRVGSRPCVQGQNHYVPVGPCVTASDPQNKAMTPYRRLDQALRVTDLLLQAGGFSAVVLDMGSIDPASTNRIELSTWFRYRAAAERTQASVVILAQNDLAKSSAGLVLRLESSAACDETTVLTGTENKTEVMRQRFTETSNVISLKRPPQRVTHALWKSRTAWAGRR